MTIGKFLVSSKALYASIRYEKFPEYEADTIHISIKDNYLTGLSWKPIYIESNKNFEFEITKEQACGLESILSVLSDQPITILVDGNQHIYIQSISI